VGLGSSSSSRNVGGGGLSRIGSFKRKKVVDDCVCRKIGHLESAADTYFLSA
jgi:hypothetical protein